MLFSVWSVQNVYKEVFSSVKGREGKGKVEFRDASLPGYGLGSRGIEMRGHLRNNCKKGIRL
jgi:hypothetical protein